MFSGLHVLPHGRTACKFRSNARPIVLSFSGWDEPISAWEAQQSLPGSTVRGIRHPTCMVPMKRGEQGFSGVLVVAGSLGKQGILALHAASTQHLEPGLLKPCRSETGRPS